MALQQMSDPLPRNEEKEDEIWSKSASSSLLILREAVRKQALGVDVPRVCWWKIKVIRK